MMLSRKSCQRQSNRLKTGPGLPLVQLGICALLALLMELPANLLGQGISQPVVMHTGSGLPLLSQSVSYTNLLSGVPGSMVNINFGFATAEQARPGAFLDSFTISIGGPDGTSYLVTVDGSGIHWAPNVPGALPVADSSIQSQSAPFLVPTEGLPNVSSFVLGYTLPQKWVGVPLTINFDLFDNQDNLASLGYFLVVPASVPEPSSVALLILGLIVGQFFRKRFF
jgi:hypothetical protein